MDQKQTNIIRLPKVMEMTGLSRSTIYRYFEKGEFPRPISLGERAIGWSLHEVQGWVDQKTAARNAVKGIDYGDC